MAVLGATRAFKDWQVANGLAEPDDRGADEGAGEESTGSSTRGSGQSSTPTDDARDFSDEELQTMEKEDPLALIDSLNMRVGKPVTAGLASREWNAE